MKLTTTTTIRQIAQDIEIPCDVLIELIRKFGCDSCCYAISGIDADNAITIEFDVSQKEFRPNAYCGCTIFPIVHCLAELTYAVLNISSDDIEIISKYDTEDWWYSVLFYFKNYRNALNMSRISPDYVKDEYSSKTVGEFANYALDDGFYINDNDDIMTNDNLFAELKTFIKTYTWRYV